MNNKVMERNEVTPAQPVVLRAYPCIRWHMGRAVRRAIDAHRWKHEAIAALLGDRDGSRLSRLLADPDGLPDADLPKLPIEIRTALAAAFSLHLGVTQ